MQPYFFPYIGYFQLIQAADKFLLYDDVNYIKQGWINRNRILVNGQSQFLTLRLSGASSYKKINEIEIDINKKKILKTVQQAYAKAPLFSEVFPLVERVISFDDRNLARFVSQSIFAICSYLDIDTSFEISSKLNIYTNLAGQDRVIAMCKYYNANTYINAIGGKVLYSQCEFAKNDIKLQFLQPGDIEYEQNKNHFVPHLSIIDVLMFNTKEKIKYLLENYSLV
jgi:hypothetical protein